jgi:hypothetical protein
MILNECVEHVVTAEKEKARFVPIGGMETSLWYGSGQKQRINDYFTRFQSYPSLLVV